MSPKRSRTLRRYAAFHQTVGHPLAVTHRSLKKAVTDLHLGHKDRGKLYRRIEKLTRFPVAVPQPDDGTMELRLAGLVPERIAVAKLRRVRRRPEEGRWLYTHHISAQVRTVVGLPQGRTFIIPLD